MRNELGGRSVGYRKGMFGNLYIVSGMDERAPPCRRHDVSWIVSRWDEVQCRKPKVYGHYLDPERDFQCRLADLGG